MLQLRGDSSSTSDSDASSVGYEPYKKPASQTSARAKSALHKALCQRDNYVDKVSGWIDISLPNASDEQDKYPDRNYVQLVAAHILPFQYNKLSEKRKMDSSDGPATESSTDVVPTDRTPITDANTAAVTTERPATGRAGTSQSVDPTSLSSFPLNPLLPSGSSPSNPPIPTASPPSNPSLLSATLPTLEEAKKFLR